MSDLINFFGGPVLNAVYTPEACEQRKIRIRLAIAAYTYEYESWSFMSDAEFDELAKKVDKNVDTGNPLLDKFFREEFSTDTGMWIRKHPELDKLAWIYNYYYKDKKK